MSVLTVFLPVVVAMALGYFCKRKQIVTAEGLAGINSLITKILLPVVLFQSMATISYSSDNLVLFLTMFVAVAVSYGLGFVFRRFMGDYKMFTPWMLSCMENGMFGFSLFVLLAGAENLHYIAAVDMGNAVFANSIYLGTISIAGGGRFSIKDTVRNMFHIPAFLGTLLGIAVGVTGMYSRILGYELGSILDSLLSFISEPLSFLVLFAVGYKFTVYRELMAPVLKTVGVRVVIMAVLFWICRSVVFASMEYDRLLDMALTLTFALPASMVVPIYATTDKDNAYTSTTLSMYMIVTIVVFVILAAMM